MVLQKSSKSPSSTPMPRTKQNCTPHTFLLETTQTAPLICQSDFFVGFSATCSSVALIWPAVYLSNFFLSVGSRAALGRYLNSKIVSLKPSRSPAATKPAADTDLLEAAAAAPLSGGGGAMPRALTALVPPALLEEVVGVACLGSDGQYSDEKGSMEPCCSRLAKPGSVTFRVLRKKSGTYGS